LPGTKRFSIRFVDIVFLAFLDEGPFAEYFGIIGMEGRGHANYFDKMLEGMG
jgi:hypothetical protein